MNRSIGLLGNGSQANEIESYLPDEVRVSFRAVSAAYLNSSSGQELINIDDPGSFKSFDVIVAVGAPAIKKILIESWSGGTYRTLVSRDASLSKSVNLGNGVVIAAGAVVTTDVVIGDHVLINIGVTISHNCMIGAFSTISPGVHIAGNVEIGEGVFIGIGAVIRNDIKIASGVVIGAGTVVLENITTENSVVVGMPGKELRVNKGWINEI